MNKTTMNAEVFTACLGTSSEGKPEPRIDFHMPAGVEYGTAMTWIEKVSGAVELATPNGERWEIYLGYFREFSSGRVLLELAEGTAAEAERAMAILRSVAATLSNRPRIVAQWLWDQE